MKNEKRVASADVAQMRAFKDEDGKRFIEGYGAVFNQESRLIFDWEGEYKEILEPTAFDRVLTSPELDVLLTFNHSKDVVLARYTPARDQMTLTLKVDERGLYYSGEVNPDSATANEIWTSIERGDLNESSFVFRVEDNGQRWDFNGDVAKRYISEVSGLYDVSVVWKGAYATPDLDAAERSYKDAKAQIEKELYTDEMRVNSEIEKDSVKLLKLKGGN